MAEDKILDRIGKLMRLALNNPNREEAASAALKAIALMDEHKIRLSRVVTEQPTPDFKPTFSRTPFDEALKDLIRRQYYGYTAAERAEYEAGARQRAADEQQWHAANPFTRPGRGAE